MNTISTFAELADLMEPEWNIAEVPANGREIVLKLTREKSTTGWVTWDVLRLIEGTVAKFTGGSNKDGTQTITIILETK